MEDEKKVSEGGNGGGIMNKIFLFLGMAVLVIGVIFGYKYKDVIFSTAAEEKVLSQEEAKAKAIDYINKNLVQPGTKVDVKNIALQSDLYKIDLLVGEQDATIYMSKDGATLFPNFIDMNEKVAGQEETAPQEEIAKAEKPLVELFVMSYCPYGTQIEKGILPVLGALGDKIDFSLKFVDYAMHDKKELDENLREYCIQKSQPEKLNAYLECFLKKGEGTENACINSSGIDSEEITSCMSESDKEFKVTENYGDKDTWSGGQFPPFNADKSDNEKYGVQGSPTLVINGVVAKSGRDSAGLLKVICSAFNEQPSECEKELSSATPSPGFGEGTGASTEANCGS